MYVSVCVRGVTLGLSCSPLRGEEVGGRSSERGQCVAAPLCVLDIAEKKTHDGVGVGLQASDGVEVKGALDLWFTACQQGGEALREAET